MGVKETEGASVISATTDLTYCTDSRANVSVVTQVIKYQKYCMCSSFHVFRTHAVFDH